MWQEYHQLRTSDSFREDWDKFLLESLGEPASPTFFQFVSHRIFRELVKDHHQLPETEGNSCAQNAVTNLEEKALRYVAGYVCREVQSKLKKSSLPQKEDMVLFISSDLSGDEWDDSIGHPIHHHLNHWI